MLTEKQREIIRERADGATGGPWKTCNKGNCSCGQVWANDHPVAVVEHGEWGDEYPAIRMESDGPKAYIERIAYGEIPEDMAKANAIFIAASRIDVPALDDTCNELQETVENIVHIVIDLYDQIDKLRNALGFYGDKKNYKENTVLRWSEAQIDNGERAREMLNLIGFKD